MKRKLVIICVVLLLIGTTQRASAQFYNVRLNTLALASGTLNVGIGVTLSDKLSLDVSGYWNPIRTANFRSTFLVGQAGVRLWRFEPNVGPFIGIHATGGTFNIGNRKAHYKGYLAGAGVSYGYCWLLNNRWNLTAEVGIGCYYISDTRRDYFTPWTQDELIRHNRRIALGPSKAEVSFSYLF